MSQELHVAGIRVRDVLGVKEASIAPGRITILKGRNGSSKSSILSAVQAALGRGSLARLKRVGQAEEEIDPEVVLVIEGPGSKTYHVTRSGDDIDVKARVGNTAAFEDVPRPTEFLKDIFDPVGSNPVRFLQAPDKDRVIYLLEALVLKFDLDALLKEMGLRLDELAPIPAGLHPLEAIAMYRDQVFTRRTGVNRDEKAAKQSADQLRRSMPAEMPADPAAAIATLDAEVGTLARDLGSRETAVAADHDATVEKARAAHREAEAGIKATFQAKSKDLRAAHDVYAANRRREVEEEISKKAAQVEAEIAKRREDDETRLEQLDAVRDAAVAAAHEARTSADAALAALRNTLGAKKEQLATLREQARQAAGMKALDEQARKFDATRDAMKAESERLTAAIDALDAHRRRMAENLPIPGLSIEGKEIRVNGIPFDQLNTGQRVELAVKVACLRARGSKLPCVFVDGAEALDTEHFEALVEALKRENVQAFLARVADTEFQVETDVAEVGA